MDYSVVSVWSLQWSQSGLTPGQIREGTARVCFILSVSIGSVLQKYHLCWMSCLSWSSLIVLWLSWHFWKSGTKDMLTETAGTAVHFTIVLLMHHLSLWSNVCQPFSPKHTFVTLCHPLWADSQPAQQESNTASCKEAGCLSQYLNKQRKSMLFKSSVLKKLLGWLIWLETIYLIKCNRVWASAQHSHLFLTYFFIPFLNPHWHCESELNVLYIKVSVFISLILTQYCIAELLSFGYW